MKRIAFPSDEQLLLAEIKKSPCDTILPLVYADAIQDRDEARAQFIREYVSMGDLRSDLIAKGELILYDRTTGRRLPRLTRAEYGEYAAAKCRG